MEDPHYNFDSPEYRNTLKKENRLYKTALDHEVEELKEQAVQLGKIALVAGGALLGTYLVIKYLRSGKEDDEEGEKAMVSGAKNQIVLDRKEKENKFTSVIKEQLALLLIGFIREKLSELTGIEKKKVQEKEHELTGKTPTK